MRKYYRNKKIVAVIAILLVITLAVGGVGLFAVLRDTSGTVNEKMNKADVTCEVNEDYTVTNTSNIPALIRVRVIVNQTENGEIIPGDVPSYTVMSDWTKKGDYLYYNGIVDFENGSNKTTAPISIDGGGAQVTVLAEAIQAASDAAKDEWGTSYSNGSWT